MKVLVTGGAGYIGSTIASALSDAGHVPVILDDLSTGRREFAREHPFYAGDIADEALLARIVEEHPDLAAAIHCAARIVVPESVEQPDGYYDNNVGRSITLLRVLARLGVRRVLFSSSASIYAPESDFSVTEASAVVPGSPYARTKAMVEQVLEDFAAAGLLSAVSLRYFNPIGADPALRTGLQSLTPTHLLGRLITTWEAGEPFAVTGVDWPTRDGTGIRDYVHVWDLAQAHVAALESFDALLATAARPGYVALNVGTGTGTTVREFVAAFAEVVGAPVPVVEGPRRAGDAVGAYARGSALTTVTGWQPKYDLRDGIRDSLAWRSAWRATLQR